jgi:hypothetical protein
VKIPGLLRTVGPIVGGALAGLAVVGLWGARPENRPPTASPAAAVEPAPPPARLDETSLDRRRIAELEAKVAQLSAAASASSKEAPLPSPPPEDREAREQRVLSEHARLLGRHDAEARDATWAPGEERELRTKFDDLARSMKTFSLRSVDCRTATCVASLEWPSEDAARGDLQTLLNGSAKARCAREIAFPPASGPGPYAASMVLDCTEVRWGDVPAQR